MTQSRSMAMTKVRPQESKWSGGTHWGRDIVPHDIEAWGTCASAEIADAIVASPRQVGAGLGRPRFVKAARDYVVISNVASTSTRDDEAVALPSHIAQLSNVAPHDKFRMEWNPYSIPPIFQFKELLILQGGDPTISGLNVSIVGLGGCLVLGDASLLSVWSLNPLFVQADDLADNLLIGSGLIELRQSKPRPTIETVLNEIALVPRFGLSISQRLRVLCLQQAEDPDSAGISIESMESFLAFLRSVQDLRLPSLSLTPDGNIYSSWRDHDRVLSAEFLSNTTARYVLFRPAPGGAGQKLRSAGSAPANQLLSIPETSAATWVLL